MGDSILSILLGLGRGRGRGRAGIEKGHGIGRVGRVGVGQRYMVVAGQKQGISRAEEGLV